MVVDQDFVSQLRDHEEPAILAFVDRYYTPIHRYLSRLLGDPQVAAELTQETFLEAYTTLPRLVYDSHLSAWLFQIATNLARKHHRRRCLIDWTSLDTRVAHPASLEQRIVQQDLIERALAQLPLDQKACLLLHAWAGLTCAEIARVVGKTEDAVKMMLMRARRQFRAAYDVSSVEGQAE